MAPADLVHAVRGVARGDVLLAPALIERLLDRFVSKPPPSLRSRRLDALTDRERGVLTLVAAGKSNAEIAAELYLTEATIKTYVSHLLSKLDVRDRVQLTTDEPISHHNCADHHPGLGNVPRRSGVGHARNIRSRRQIRPGDDPDR